MRAGQELFNDRSTASNRPSVNLDGNNNLVDAFENLQGMIAFSQPALVDNPKHQGLAPSRAFR
jgi:hypothetical protein